MKKSLIALAVVSTFAAQAAMAAGDAVTIYGQANAGIESIQNGTQTNNQTTNHVSSQQSRLGFKGAEDLGDGLSAIWQIEEQINLASSGQGSPGTAGAANSTNSNNSTVAYASGSTNFTSRDTFVGLSSASIGTGIVGIHDTPYKMATRGYDVFADSIADNRSIMGTSGYAVSSAAASFGDVRLNNVLAYISPAINGFTFAGATVTGAETATTTGTIKGGATSLALLYGAGPISGSFAWQKVTIGSAGTGTLGNNNTSSNINGLLANDSVSEWKLGGGYDFGVGVINAVYEKNSSSTQEASGAFAANGGNPLDRSAFYLAGKYHVNGNDDLKLAYTSAGNLGAVQNTGAKQVALGYDHNLSKRTTVYALYTRVSNGSAAGAGSADSGYTLATTDSGAQSGAPVNGAITPSAFALGLKHAF